MSGKPGERRGERKKNKVQHILIYYNITHHVRVERVCVCVRVRLLFCYHRGCKRVLARKVFQDLFSSTVHTYSSYYIIKSRM